MDRPYTYRAKLVRVIDGDTYEIDIDLGFGATLRLPLRLFGVNSPETRGDERPMGLAAKKFVEELFHSHDEEFLVTTVKPREKYGRYLATVRLFSDSGSVSFDLGGLLIAQGFAKEMK